MEREKQAKTVGELVGKKSSPTLENYRERAENFIRGMGRDPSEEGEDMIQAIMERMKLEDKYRHVEFTEEEKQEILEEHKRKLIRQRMASEGAKREKEYWDKVRGLDKERKFYKPEEVLTIWKHRMKDKIGIEPVMDKWNMKQIRTLCLYFAEDTRFEGEGDGYSLDKGLLLYGPHGCGKTAIMRGFQINPRESFNMVSVLELDSTYQRSGMDAMTDYVRKSNLPGDAWTYFRQSQGSWCFDDMGQEKDQVAYFGDKINVMDWILRESYTYRKSMRIHVTTNMSSEEMENRYGFMKISGRLKEMFNLVWFSKHAPNRRK